MVFCETNRSQGLFGMNVNALAANPAWQWYIVVVVPFMSLVLGVWMLCKHLPVCYLFATIVALAYILQLLTEIQVTRWYDEHISNPLKLAFGGSVAGCGPGRVGSTPSLVQRRSVSNESPKEPEASEELPPRGMAFSNRFRRGRISHRRDIENAAQLGEGLRA